MDEQPGRRRAALSRRAERAPERAVDRKVHVRVVENQDRVLSPHLQMESLVLLRAFHADRLADRSRSGEGDDADVRVVHERIADLGARSRDDVENPVGKAGLLEDLRELEHGGGRVRAGLMTTVLPQMSAAMDFHAGIAIGKFHGVMKPHTPTGSRVAIAHLFFSSDGAVTPNRRRPSPAARNAMSIASWTSPRVSASTLPISRVMIRLISSLRALEHVARGVEVLGALRSGRQAPVAIRLLRGRDGGVHVFRIRFLVEPDQLVAIGRVAVLEGLPGSGGDPAAPDPVLIFGGRHEQAASDRTAARARAPSAARRPSRLRAGNPTCRRCPGSARPPR